MNDILFGVYKIFVFQLAELMIVHIFALLFHKCSFRLVYTQSCLTLLLLCINNRLIIFIPNYLMSTAVQTKANHYIKLDGENVPINLVVGGIKCLDCKHTFHPDQLQRHLSTHINPQFIRVSPLANANIPDKINLHKVEDPQKLQDIWVKSVLPSQMPQVQKIKKVALRPEGEDNETQDQYGRKRKVGHKLANNQQVPLQIGFSGLNRFKPQTDLPSDLGQTADSVEQIDQLEVRKNIRLNLMQNLINRKEIHFYKSEHGIPINVDNTVIRQRKSQDTQTEVSDSYQVIPVVEQEKGGQLKVGQFKKIPSKKENRQTYILGSSLKNPANSLKISTLSRRRIYEPEDKSEFDGQKSTVSPYHIGSPDNIDHHLMCRCCKGFYCEQCKSSVPPIYRPVPDRDGNYHFHPQQNERAVEFYREHFYKNSARVCTHCSKDYLNQSEPYESRRI